MKIINDFLKKVMPQSTEANRQKYIEWLNYFMPKYGIDSDKEVAAFIAQIGHETQYLNKLTENLNYSKEGLLKTFPKYFSSATATLYANKPNLIANKVYANRMGNGNEDSGDGYKFRGRGGFMITGKDMYEKCGNALGEDFVKNPELLSTPKYAVQSACWYWNYKKLNDLV